MEVLLNISEKKATDVLVIGGGTAGVFAAISAARSGAKTLLVEKNSILGGTMTVANVNFPGFTYSILAFFTNLTHKILSIIHLHTFYTS